MRFYDMCVLTPVEELERTAGLAEKLGWSGICILAERKEIKKLKPKVKNAGIDISLGLLLEPRSKSGLKKQINANRKNYEIIAVKGGKPEINRAAAEIRGVDILIGWESNAGKNINYITAKLAAENNVSIAFSIQPLIVAYERSRADIISKFIEVARFVRKYKTPFVLTSGALSFWDMRAPSELQSFGRILGFRDPDIKKAMSGRILKENRKRLSGKWIMLGVEVE